MTDYAPLWYWVREREAIRLRKEAGEPFPWTEDHILRDYRFCCVRREDDRVTRWVDRYIRRPYDGNPLLWFMLCVARQINWPPALEALMMNGAWPEDEDFFDSVSIGAVLENMARRGEKVFTGAYIVTAPPTKGEKKTRFVSAVTLGKLWEHRGIFANRVLPGASMRSVWSWLQGYTGWGPFLAYQAVVDMRFCPHLLAEAADVTTWAAAGPGTIRGLNRVHGRLVDAPLSQDRALGEILPIFASVTAETGVTVDLSDVPNILCETDKYLRVKNGEGTPRARYVPGRGS